MKTKKITFNNLNFAGRCVNAISKVVVAVILIFSITTNLKAQTLQLFNNHGFVANGTVITFSDTFNVSLIEAHLWVYNSDNRSHDIRCKKIVNQAVAGSSNFFCWGACIDTGQYVSDPLTIAGGDTNKYDFAGDYMPNHNAGTTIITYVFFDDANNNDSAWFIAHYNAFDPYNIGNKNNKSSLGLITLRSNIVNDNIFVKLNESTELDNVLLRIIDITGKINKEIILKSGLKELNIGASQLKSGMYFISVVQNQQKVQTLKFIKQ